MSLQMQAIARLRGWTKSAVFGAGGADERLRVGGAKPLLDRGG
jgi:hypothetical protein